MSFNNVKFKLNPERLVEPLYSKKSYDYIWQQFFSFLNELNVNAKTEAEKEAVEGNKSIFTVMATEKTVHFTGFKDLEN